MTKRRRFIDHDLLPDVIAILIVIALVAGCVGIGYLGDKFTCDAKTENIGFPSQWTILAGCQIEVKPGQWIPLESYYFKQE